MTKILFSCHDAVDTFRRAQNLADDLRRIAADDLPTAADLAKAPVIDHWTMSVRPESCLVGTISGHPSIGLMRPGITSGIFAFSPDLGWVRTLSRLYALGRAAGDDDGRRAQ
jgi:hypothetical protein